MWVDSSAESASSWTGVCAMLAEAAPLADDGSCLGVFLVLRDLDWDNAGRTTNR